jgi:sodium-dependent phosphate transporter
VLIVWKGAASLKLDNFSTGEVVGTILGVAFGVMFLCILFFIPYLYRLLIKEDWQLRWYHIFFGPLLLRRGEVPPNPDAKAVVQDYYRGYATADGIVISEAPAANDSDVEKQAEPESKATDPVVFPTATTNSSNSIDDTVKPVRQGKWYTPANLPHSVWKGLMHGVNQDVVNMQKEKDILAGDINKLHAAAPHYDNKAEHTYSFLQILTAATASFAHGANDVSK